MVGLASVKTFVAALQLLLLLLGSGAVNAAETLYEPLAHHLRHPIFHHPHHHHMHSPAPAPAPAPARTHHHHTHPPMRVAVQGVVYCKSCKYSGIDTLQDSIPILGAVVKLNGYNTMLTTTTDKNGYFFLEAPNMMSSYEVRKFDVSLVSSPLPLCDKVTNLNDGLTGASLRYEKIETKLPYELYTVGPLAFEPPKC
ncbi:hypothetical protein NE237_002558 [Protea cynaroides]|uniref:Pollen Ole e 1 allergen and extensin family protein n=1 Tax=Protea cynaroides TaxID=273540 RepID=A0A9Q0KV80_9MAGN|nr:hypothetical protein NE237_002558 [Protea cynaroides]